VDLSPLEKKVEALEIYSPYATGTFNLYLETIVQIGKIITEPINTRVKSLKAHDEGEVEELDFFKNFSHRSTIKKDNPSSFFFKADTKSSSKPAKQQGDKQKKGKKETQKKRSLISKIAKKVRQPNTTMTKTSNINQKVTTIRIIPKRERFHPFPKGTQIQPKNPKQMPLPKL